MHRHFLAERRDFFRELARRFRAQAIDPLAEHFAGCGVEARRLFRRQFQGHGDGRKVRTVQDFVRVGIADSTEQAWISQGALDGVTLAHQSGGEIFERRVEHLEASTVEVAEAVRAGDDE